MKKTIFGIVLGLAFGSILFGQTQPSVNTVVPDASRFEIIQAPYDSGITFRLDKFTGVVDRLGVCPKDDSIGSNKCWKEMVIVDLPKYSSISRPRFQIVINSPLKLIILLQTETGQSWQFGIEPMDKWHPFIECLDRNDKACLWRPF